MCKFIKSIAVVILMVLLICLVSMAASFYYIRMRFDFRINPTQHIVVIGNSLGATSINDSILTGWRNLSRRGEHYIQNIPILENVLAVNSQIDTVLIGVGHQSLAGFTDDEFYNPGVQAFREWGGRIAISGKEEMKFYYSNPNFISYLLTGAFHTVIKPTFLSQFSPLQFHNMQDFTSPEQSYESYYSYEMLLKEHSVQVLAFEKLIDICKKHHVQCVILNTPMYRKEFYKEKVYVEYLSTLEDSLLIADYTSFAFPDDTLYYSDIYHLHHLGASYFSKHIKQNGLKLQYLVDYVREKKASTRTSEKEANKN